MKKREKEYIKLQVCGSLAFHHILFVLNIVCVKIRMTATACHLCYLVGEAQPSVNGEKEGISLWHGDNEFIAGITCHRSNEYMFSVYLSFN